MRDCEINVLGTVYHIKIGSKIEFPSLDDMDGYTDTTIKLIVINDMIEARKDVDSKENLAECQNQIARHEILHAFLFESGLDCNTFSFSAWATNEEIVDWFAIQYPKIKKVYEEVGIG